MGSLKSAVKKLFVNALFAHLRRSYSQSGEDIIISDLFTRLGIGHPTYLDIGANEPVALSNTYRLYTRGSRGVCVEPNPVLYKKLLAKRKGDVCINAGVAFDERTSGDFYLFPEKFHGLNTFSKSDAAFWEHTGTKEIGKPKVEKTISMPLININEIMQKHFAGHPNFISLDVEGLDLEIARTIDFNQFRPEVFCVETLAYAENGKEIKNQSIIDFFTSKGYFIYADTYINTIFCRRDAYERSH